MEVPRKSHNRAIQGLRALAVAAVVGDHLFHKPSGGFVGVDIFFVISGFLITGLLLREVTRTGRIDLVDFYRRRIKRTVPLAVVVIGISLLAGSLLFPAYRAAQLGDAARAAGTFSINWQLIGLGTDYLHATDVPTPLQHFWSLAVEEQFYLVWPLALLAVVQLGRRLLSARVLLVLGLVAAATITSLAFAFWQTAAAPTAAYFSTFSRAWELGVGAVLAVSTPALRRIPSLLKPAIAWTGLIGILVAFVKVSPDAPFPAPWALLPVLATAFVIAGSEGAEDAQIYPLTNRLAQYLGDLSYSVYLWHFPVIIFIGTVLVESKASHALALTMTVALSIVSYHVLETPLRKMSWRRALSRRGGRVVSRPAPRTVVAGCVAVASVLAVPAFVTPPAAMSAELPPSVNLVSALDGHSPWREAVASAATTQAAWPTKVEADIRNGVQALPSIWTRQGCLWTQHDVETPAAKAARCTTGTASATKTAIIFGDSIAISYYPALRDALDSRVWRIEVLAAEQCPAWEMTVVRDDGSAYPECDAFRRSALQQIAHAKPDLVLVASSYSALWRSRSSDGRSPDDAWKSGAEKTLTALGTASDRVLLLDAPPMGPSLRDCLTPTATPLKCSGVVDGSFARAFDAEVAAVQAVDAPGVQQLPTVAWYCDPHGVCPPVIGGDQTLADGMHPSETDADRIGRLLKDALDTGRA